MTVDRGTPGIEAAERVIYERCGFPSMHAADQAVAAFLAVEPPADVLKALLEAQPEAFREALAEMLRAPRTVQEAAYALKTETYGDCSWEFMAVHTLDTAVASLKPKEDA